MRKCLVLGLAILLPASFAAAAGPEKKGDAHVPAKPMWLRRDLERIRAKYHLPSLAASIVIGREVVVAVAVGQRKLGDPTPVTRNDRYQIGSVSKPMTATLIGALVEAGKMSFDDTIEHMFPELVGEIHPSYRKATVRQLLAHTSGLPYGPAKKGPRKPTPDPKQAIANRYYYVRHALTEKPEAKPGKKYVYSGGAIIAVNYAERSLNTPYEDLMEQYVFRKLGMTTAGKFRMATMPDRMDGPWPHVSKDGRIVPIPPKVDRGMSRGPVGSVCCSVIDLGRWAAAHLQGERGHPSVLRVRTFRELHAVVTPPGHSTMSFGRNRPKWSRGEVLSHSGCDGTCYALVHIAPAENFATCILCNYGGQEAKDACNKDLHHLLVQRAKELKQGKIGGLKRGR